MVEEIKKTGIQNWITYKSLMQMSTQGTKCCHMIRNCDSNYYYYYYYYQYAEPTSFSNLSTWTIYDPTCAHWWGQETVLSAVDYYSGYLCTHLVTIEKGNNEICLNTNKSLIWQTCIFFILFDMLSNCCRRFFCSVMEANFSWRSFSRQSLAWSKTWSTSLFLLCSLAWNWLITSW